MDRLKYLILQVFVQQNIVIGKRSLCIGLCLLAGQLQIVLAKESSQYNFDIQADFRKATKLTGDDDCIPIKVKVTQSKHLLRSLSWQQNDYLSNFRANGQLRENDGQWQWEVPKRGGMLRYCAQLAHVRGERYDSRITKNWALFRADDLFPAATSVVARNSHSRTRLSFKLPAKWNSVTPYRELSEHQYEVDNPGRLFDRPTGWVQLGELGIRRDNVANTKVAVAAPIGQEVTRLEIMTLISFTIPTVRNWFPDFPDRLLVVSANDGMWRGALSGPSSLYLHGERPLVSENGTSTLLHELVHVAFQRQATNRADWIDEGLAEYMAIVLLHRAGGLTDRRFRAALEEQERWGASVDKLGKKNSNGAATAKAVTLFAQLHQEIGDKHFRKLVQQLAKPGPAISSSLLRELAEDISGKKIKSLP